MKKVTLNCKYVQGFLRNGHFELDLDDEEYKKFEFLSKKEQFDWIKDAGDLYIDSYKVEDYLTEDNYNIKDV